MVGTSDPGSMDAEKSPDTFADDFPGEAKAATADKSADAMTKGTCVTLLVTGDAPRSRRARANIADALEALGYEPAGVHEVDLLVHPQVALDKGIFASPALIIGGPGSDCLVMYGDLSDTLKLRAFLWELED